MPTICVGGMNEVGMTLVEVAVVALGQNHAPDGSCDRRVLLLTRGTCQESIKIEAGGVKLP